MPKLSLAKLERHRYSAADCLRQEELDAATYKGYIFGMLFRKRCSDVFDAERERSVEPELNMGWQRKNQRDMAKIPNTIAAFLGSPKAFGQVGYHAASAEPEFVSGESFSY